MERDDLGAWLQMESPKDLAPKPAERSLLGVLNGEPEAGGGREQQSPHIRRGRILRVLPPPGLVSVAFS